jgi:hypothetical protein
VLLFLLIKIYLKSEFNLEKLNSLTNDRSRWINLADNPCVNLINGEPVDSGKEYVKVHLECIEGSSDNTLSLKAVEGNTWEDVINTLARVNLFNPDDFLIDNSNWKCFRGGVLINLDSEIKNSDYINCNEK